MLDAAMTKQLRAYLQNIRTPIELVGSLDDSAAADELRQLLGAIAALSDKVSMREDGNADRRPSFRISRVGEDVGVSFAGIPLGHEFTSLVLALLHVGGHPPKEDAELLDEVRALQTPLHFETFYSLSCQNCPDVVQALNMMAALNPNVRHVAIDGALNQDEVERRKIMAVPTVFLNGELFGQGRMDLAQIVAQLDSEADTKAAAKMAAKEPFDVLVVGGGPAGAAAAIYAARKGIRTGIVTERFGGQVLDTMAIENFISMQETEGPKLATAMEQHVRDYPVDIMAAQTVTGLEPADTPGGLHRVQLANGASLGARTLILTTGARWRQMNVPGEDTYRTRGVTYCPHCDGPLFKGKATAVIGGGNSGAEAAIDLAGVTEHVTLIEYMDELRADQVLQDKLASLPNVRIVKGAETTEVVGDGEQVTHLHYRDRQSGDMRQIALAGIFVQIGLVPNTEWLRNHGDGENVGTPVVPLSPRGEIDIDAACRTVVPGIFAAGDVTTTPYKQIVIAMGEGAKAALSAFDYLIRL